jgi:hypothetical protein
MGDFSPVTRRILAVGILIFLLIVTISWIVTPALSLVDTKLDELADLRFRRARLDALLKRPTPPASVPIPSSLYVSAPNREAAAEQVLVGIRDIAVQHQVLIEQATVLPAGSGTPSHITINLAASGPEVNLVAFINALERGTPMIRLSPWKLASQDNPQMPLHLAAQAFFTWNGPDDS